MNSSTMKYLAIGGGVLLLFLLMRNQGGSQSSNGLALTAASLSNSQATNIQLSQINAERDAIAEQQKTARMAVVAGMFESSSKNKDTITAQTIQSMTTITQGVLMNAAVYQQSIIASDLAKTLAGYNVNVERYRIDAEKYIAHDDNKTAIKLGQYEKDMNRSDNKTSAFNNTVTTIGKVLGGGFL